MAVVFYQLLIVGSIVAAYFAATRLRRHLRRPKLSPISAAVLAGAGWTVFTLINVITLPLIAVQLLFTWGAIAVLWIVRRKSREIETLRQALRDQDPELIERVLDAARATRLRTIEGRDHLRELHRALDGAQETLIILSGWLNDFVIDRNFTQRLSRALARGVDVYLGYGWTSAAQPAEASASEVRGLAAVTRLAEEALYRGRGRLYVAKWPNHSKLLIRDDQYAICGSHNWLSNRGFSNEERSWVVQDPAFVMAERDALIRRFHRSGDLAAS